MIFLPKKFLGTNIVIASTVEVLGTIRTELQTRFISRALPPKLTTIPSFPIGKLEIDDFRGKWLVNKGKINNMQIN